MKAKYPENSDFRAEKNLDLPFLLPILSLYPIGYIPTLGIFLQKNEDFPLWTKALISEIKQLMKDDRVDLTHLIRSMQRAEGHSDCFGTAVRNCDRMDCSWRKYCLEDSLEPSVENSNLNHASTDSYKKSEVEKFDKKNGDYSQTGRD